MTLRDVFNLVTREQLNTWLYLPGESVQWTLETEAFLLDPEFDDETDESVLPDGYADKGLRETLDTPTIADCVKWADRLVGRADDAVRLESFLYYNRFDAFLPKIGAPVPPSPEEIRRRTDLEFYDKLGPEDSKSRCKHEDCSRGVVRFSVFCKRHHFEMIQHRECPFEH